MTKYGLHGCSEQCFRLLVHFLRQTGDYKVNSKYELYLSLVEAGQDISERKVSVWVDLLKRKNLVARDNEEARWAWVGEGDPIEDLEKASLAWKKSLPLGD